VYLLRTLIGPLSVEVILNALRYILGRRRGIVREWGNYATSIFFVGTRHLGVKAVIKGGTPHLRNSGEHLARPNSHNFGLQWESSFCAYPLAVHTAIGQYRWGRMRAWLRGDKTSFVSTRDLAASYNAPFGQALTRCTADR
jgi:hypothetical protein